MAQWLYFNRLALQGEGILFALKFVIFHFMLSTNGFASFNVFRRHRLGAAGFAGAMGAGGVIGASGGGIAIAVSGKNGEQKNEGISINAKLAHCNWRQWE